MCVVVYTMCDSCDNRIINSDEFKRCENCPLPSDAIHNVFEMTMCPFFEAEWWGTDGANDCFECIDWCYGEDVPDEVQDGGSGLHD